MNLLSLARLTVAAVATIVLMLTSGPVAEARLIRSAGSSGASNQCGANSLDTVIGVFAEIPGTSPQAYDSVAGETSFSFLDPIPGLFGSGCGDTWSYEFDFGEDLELGVSWLQLLFPGDFWGNATPSYEFTITSDSDPSLTFVVASPDTLHTFLAPVGLVTGAYSVELNLVITADTGFGLADTPFGPGDIWAGAFDPATQSYFPGGISDTFIIQGDYVARLVIVPGSASSSTEGDPVPEPGNRWLVLCALIVLTGYQLHRQRTVARG